MIRNLRPLGDKILVEIQEVKQTESGLFIPDSAVNDFPTKQAVILAVGPEVTHVTTGNTILYPKYSGTACGDNLLILREDEILGVIENVL